MKSLLAALALLIPLLATAVELRAPEEVAHMTLSLCLPGALNGLLRIKP